MKQAKKWQCAWCLKANPTKRKFCDRKACIESRAYADSRPYGYV